MYGEILYSESSIGGIRSLIKHVKDAFNKNGIFSLRLALFLLGIAVVYSVIFKHAIGIFREFQDVCMYI